MPGMYEAFKGTKQFLTRKPKIQQPRPDNFVFRLHYQVDTVYILYRYSSTDKTTSCSGFTTRYEYILYICYIDTAAQT